MYEKNFEGTLILEKMAELRLIDEFYEALDLDDFDKAEELMDEAGLDLETINWVLEQMQNTFGTH